MKTPFGASGPDRRGFMKLTLAGAAGLGLSGLASRSFAQDADHVIIGASQEATVFNPLMLRTNIDDGLHWALFDPLFYVDAKGDYVARLAADVPTVANGGISEDGLSWDVTLRDDVTWHDGTPFTAEDVKFTMELTQRPDFRTDMRAGHDLVDTIEVVSPTRIRWTMKEAHAPYLALLARTFIIPAHAFEGVEDPNEAPFNRAPIGTGAYRWDGRAPGDNVQLVANPDYFDGAPAIGRMVLRYIPDMTVLYTQFRTGEIDVLAMQGITPDRFAEASKLPGKVATLVPTATIELLCVNCEHPILGDPVIRRALYHGIDKDSIIQALYYGLPEATESYMPRESAYFNADLPKQVFDIKAGAALLDEAGWTPGPDGIRVKDGTRLSFSCSTTSGDLQREQLQQYLQQLWASMGVEMKINNLPPSVIWGDFWNQSQYEMMVVGYTFLNGPDPDTSTAFATDMIPSKTGNGGNTFQYSNPKVDVLLQEGVRTIDPAKRKPIYAELQQIIRDELPILPIYQYNTGRGYKEGLESFEPNINNRITFWNVKDWSWS